MAKPFVDCTEEDYDRIFDTNTKGAYTLGWDMKNTSTGSYLSNSGGIGSLSQATGVEEPGSNHQHVSAQMRHGVSWPSGPW